jgi:hypothetical protein
MSSVHAKWKNCILAETIFAAGLGGKHGETE